jgi:hypothetical protein
MSQVVNFPATGTYHITFEAAKRSNDSTEILQPIQVSVDGVNVGSPIAPAGTTWGACQTSTFTVSTTGKHTVQFTTTISNPNGDADTAIDSVALVNN